MRGDGLGMAWRPCGFVDVGVMGEVRGGVACSAVAWSRGRPHGVKLGMCVMGEMEKI